MTGVIQGDTRSLDYGPNVLLHGPITLHRALDRICPNQSGNAVGNYSGFCTAYAWP